MGRVIGSIKAYVHCKMPSCKLKINNISNKYLVLYNSSFNFPVVKLRSATEVMRSLRCQLRTSTSTGQVCWCKATAQLHSHSKMGAMAEIKTHCADGCGV